MNGQPVAKQVHLRAGVLWEQNAPRAPQIPTHAGDIRAKINHYYIDCIDDFRPEHVGECQV
jgi:hypothetical protein